MIIKNKLGFFLIGLSAIFATFNTFGGLTFCASNINGEVDLACNGQWIAYVPSSSGTTACMPEISWEDVGMEMYSTQGQCVVIWNKQVIGSTTLTLVCPNGNCTAGGFLDTSMHSPFSANYNQGMNSEEKIIIG